MLNKQNFTKFFTVSLATGLVSLFVTQTSLAQVSFFIPFKAQSIQLTQQPLMSHSVMNRVAFTGSKEVESKQIWVGKADLLFHIEARESLKSVQSPLFQLSRESKDLFKKMAYRVVLQILLQNEVMAPLKQDVGLTKLNQAA